MRETTLAYARHLLALPWLESAGQALQDPDVTLVHSWKAALACCESSERDDMLVDTHNEMTQAISALRGDQWFGRNWNKMAEELREVVLKPVDSIVRRVTEEKGLPRIIADDISWCMIHACFEVELSDYIETSFYRDHVKWYERGHFPCGWDGEYPEGRLIVY